MSCCGNHDHEQKDQVKSSGHLSHSNKRNWMMMLCCVLPIVVVAAVLLINGFTGSSPNMFLYILLLICPLSHMILMPMMRKKK